MVSAAWIHARRPLLYRRGADAALDRPAYVRAASALVWLGEKLVVVQDDAAFLGVVEVATGLVDDIPFAAGPGGRRVFDAVIGNKADKPDLEAAFAYEDTLYALGSGGPLAARQVIVTWRDGTDPTVMHVPRLFEALAKAAVPAGSALNLEGAMVAEGSVMVAQRGGDKGAPDALVRFGLDELRALARDPGAALPRFEVIRCGLDALDGVALHLSDIAPHPDGLLYLATAEDTQSFYEDGAVRGSVVGILGDGAPGHAPICESRGGPIARDKVEGVAAVPGAPDRLYAVTDPDDPSRPGELLEIVIAK
jgi:hypothetical protein